MESENKLKSLRNDYDNHYREYKAIEKQDGAKHAFFVKGKILRNLWEKIKSYRHE